MSEINGPRRRLGPGGFLVAVTLLAVLSGCTETVQPNVPSVRSTMASEPTVQTQEDQRPNAKTLYTMAQILAKQGKDEQCEIVLKRCMRDDPKFVPAYGSLAELQMRNGRVDEAMQTLNDALQIKPRDPMLLNNRGMCRMLRREYELALDSFTRASIADSENQRYKANMATALGMMGRDDEALALFSMVMSEDEAEHNVAVLRKARAKLSEPSIQ